MAAVFVSYSKHDVDQARRVAEALRKAGLDVWWDANLSAGSVFRKEIGDQLKTAKCVVVLWSAHSVNSDFVVDEAEEAKRRGILIQGILDHVEPPLGFRQIQWANLQGYSGEPDARGLRDLLSGIERHVPRRSSDSEPSAPAVPAAQDSATSAQPKPRRSAASQPTAPAARITAPSSEPPKPRPKRQDPSEAPRPQYQPIDIAKALERNTRTEPLLSESTRTLLLGDYPFLAYVVAFAVWAAVWGLLYAVLPTSMGYVIVVAPIAVSMLVLWMMKDH